MIVKIIIIFILLLYTASVDAKTIKVLIIDDVFVNIPDQDESINEMGKIHGELFVNGNHYLGDIVVWKGKSGLYLVNELGLEEYVMNVVSAEVGINWHEEALKAQAVIARTYALYKIGLSKNINYDITSSVLHQVYKGTAIDPKIADAVKKTDSEVLMYDGKIIESLYHSTCGGRTENPEEVFSISYPYLKSVKSSCELSPYWIWERKIPLEEIEDAMNISGIKDISIQSYTSTERVKTLNIVHSSGSMSVKSSELRKLLGWKRLPSTKFTITSENGNIIFEGKGYGHGVGLCQWSALEMARNGKDYKDILAFFYPGTIIRIHENH